MKNKKFLSIFLTLSLSLILIQCGSDKDESSILDENFDENTLGWPEEITDAHQVFIENGQYNIISIDTARYRSSVYSLKNDYLLNLPEEYEITTSIDLKKRSLKERDITNFGILLNSSSLEYEFTVYWHGLITATEYGINTDVRKTIFKKQNKEIKSPTKIEIRIKGRDFKLFVNDHFEGNGKFRSKTRHWENLRLYTTTGSSVAIDYLKISKTKNVHNIK
jgi:hypothetical protein